MSKTAVTEKNYIEKPRKDTDRGAKKTGYLESRFRLFYNADTRAPRIDLHFHDFHKIMLFGQGNVSYLAEGRVYDLRPGDVVIIPAGAIHTPRIHDHSLYERIILYISGSFFRKEEQGDTDLSLCFRTAREKGLNLMRPKGVYEGMTATLFSELKSAASDTHYGADLLRRIKLEELLILVNRMAMEKETSYEREASSNPVILSVMDYLNTHLKDDTLDIDQVARHCALHRSYLMHLFKAEAGCTIGAYLAEKRLFLAKSLLDQGYSVTDACFESGFRNYAAFYYAFRKKYNASPKGGEAVRQVEGE